MFKRHVLIAYSSLVENGTEKPEDSILRNTTQADLNIYNMLARIHQTSPRNTNVRNNKITQSTPTTNQQLNTYIPSYGNKSTPSSNSIADVDDLVDFGSPFVDSSTPPSSSGWNSTNQQATSTNGYFNNNNIISNPSTSYQAQKPAQQTYNYNYFGTNNNITFDNNNEMDVYYPSSQLEQQQTKQWSTSSDYHQLRSLHFVFILFSSMINWTQVLMKDDNNNNLNRAATAYYTDVSCLVDAEYVQKLILQLIDQICKDQSIRTRILLSISEICES